MRKHREDKILRDLLLEMDRQEYLFTTIDYEDKVLFKINEELERALRVFYYTIERSENKRVKDVYLCEMNTGDVYLLNIYDIEGDIDEYATLDYFTELGDE